MANWWGGAEEFKKSTLYFILSQRYTITLHQNPNEPSDLVFGSPIGSARKILSYQNTKRVFYTGENEVPNFNLFDYAIGFDELDFRDRYLRMPLYYASLHYKAESVNDTTAPYKLKDNSLYALKKPSHHFKENHPNLCAVVNDESDPLKRGFASFVASNPNAPIRNAFYDALNSIEPVTGGGSVKNTLGYNVKNKSEFLSQYKFNLCFENTQGYGYVTEKIIDAYFSHTIPIYWGSPSVAKDFNPKSFVNVCDFKNFDEAIDYVRYLHTHPNAYLDMLYENPLNTLVEMSYAIFKHGGKQYKVVEGDIVLLDKMNKEPKALVELVEVLAVSKEGKLSCGKPFVNGAKIEAEVINEGRSKKVITFKKRRRKDSKTKRGFRRDFTRVRITKIVA